MTIGLGRAWQRWAVVVFGLATLGAISPVVVEPIAEQIRFTVMPDRERDRSSGVVQLFRGFQMSLADMCYNKSTHYQHRGVRYRIACEDTLDNRLKEDQQRHLAATEEATSPPVDAVTDAHEHEGHEHEDHEHPPLIPTAETDFRGILGNVEREIKPFSIAHVPHVKPQEALPWLRLATWINPEHEKAWVATAFWLQGTKRSNPEATSQAIALMEQAVALNPPREGQPYDKQGLVYMFAHLYLAEAKNPRKALEILQPAIERGERDFDQLDAVQRDWLLFNFRDAAHACRKLGLHEEAIEICKRGIELYPEDGTLRIALRREGRLLRKAREKAPSNTR
ncbi:hypothetical protein AMJ85_01500 [candidate division BRC1 bacterium SM23_51]|nr:MAG: hypothetical protein AMJ85_01500 [candidate division BRC1 bacterium SM23_51]